MSYGDLCEGRKVVITNLHTSEKQSLPNDDSVTHYSPNASLK